MLLANYRLFVSHYFSSHDDHDRLVELLERVKTFRYSIISIPEDFKYRKMSKTNLEEEIRRQMKPANGVLVLDSVYLANPGWVQFELNQAVFAKKPIIGIRQLRTKEISKAISSVADETVGWNEEVLIAAIKSLSVYATTNI